MHNLAAAYSYNYPAHSNGIGPVLAGIYLGVLIILLASMWKIFTKAGQKGWKAIIPVYSSVIECRIVGLSGWYAILLFIPLVNFIFGIYIVYKLARCFGHGAGMTILTILLIGYIILGFGKSRYLGLEGPGGVGSDAATDTHEKPPATPVAPVPPVVG